jgi:hypothetical protein
MDAVNVFVAVPVKRTGSFVVVVPDPSTKTIGEAEIENEVDCV